MSHYNATPADLTAVLQLQLTGSDCHLELHTTEMAAADAAGKLMMQNCSDNRQTKTNHQQSSRYTDSELYRCTCRPEILTSTPSLAWYREILVGIRWRSSYEHCRRWILTRIYTWPRRRWRYTPPLSHHYVFDCGQQLLHDVRRTCC